MNDAGLDSLRLSLKIGPRRPMPFPDSGKMYKLINCPTCKLKAVVLFYAPYERGYPTMCIKCGQRMAIKPEGTSMADIQQAGGFTPRAVGIRTNQRWGLDATKFYDERRDISSIGAKRAYRQGYMPSPVDHALR
jgi:hypothetical protein